MIKVINHESLELPSVNNQELIKVTYLVYLVPSTVGKYMNSKILV